MGSTCDRNSAKELGNNILEFVWCSAMVMEKWPRRPRTQKAKILQVGDGNDQKRVKHQDNQPDHWQWRLRSNRWVCIYCLSGSAVPSNRLDNCLGKSWENSIGYEW